MHSPTLHVGVEEERHAEPHAAHEEAQGHRIGVEYTRQSHGVHFSQRKHGVASAVLASGQLLASALLANEGFHNCIR